MGVVGGMWMDWSGAKCGPWTNPMQDPAQTLTQYHLSSPWVQNTGCHCPKITFFVSIYHDKSVNFKSFSSVDGS